MMTSRGVSELWTGVNHIAIVVSDVGKSLVFYTDVIGMKQVFRPNFDRYATPNCLLLDNFNFIHLRE